MTEIEALRLLSWVSLAVWLGCGGYAVRFLVGANGHRPFILMKLVLLAVGTMWAVNKVWLTYNIVRVPDGPAHVSPYIDRGLLTVLPMMLAGVLWWVMRQSVGPKP